MRNTCEGSGRSEQPGGLVKYGLSRALVLFLILLIAPYLIIAVINWDGELDRIVEAQIRHEVSLAVALDPEYQRLPWEERERMIDERVQEEYGRQGLDRPFIRRNFIHLWRAITLDLGRNSPVVGLPVEVRSLLAERVWPTVLLLGVAMLALFAVSVPVGLLLSFLSRRRGRFLDRLGTRLAAISALPAWFFGIFLILIFAEWLGMLPRGGMAPVVPQVARGEYILIVLRHLILPVSAILLGSIFAAIYSWRTFFVGHSSDEQVEPTGCSQSSSKEADRGSLLRPTLLRMITHVLIMAASVLTVSIVVEAVFNWTGLGGLLYRAISMNDTPVVLGALVIYGYVLAFLAVMVFLLDFLDVWLMQRRKRVAARGGE